MKKNLGKLIVIYGINNLGKTTQAKMLVEALNRNKITAEYIKYPIYDLKPTGPKIDTILRSGKNQSMSELEFQTLYSQNRRDFQPILKNKLKEGIHIIAEDYIGTGIAWGVTKGADLQSLENLNKDLWKENLTLLLDGTRFSEAKEKNHIHETDDQLVEKCRTVHLELAHRYGWIKVNANQIIEKVHHDIWNEIIKIL